MSAGTPDHDPRPDAGRPPGRAAVLLGLALAAALGAVVWWAARPVGPRPTRRAPVAATGPAVPYADFVGDRACRECHPVEFATHMQSGHTRTLRPAAGVELAAWLDGRSFADPERPGVTWDYALEDGALTATRSGDGPARRQVLDFAFGSGHHAMTFVSLDAPGSAPGASLEHRLTYFADGEAMAVTPGQGAGSTNPGITPRGREFDAALTQRCFACHATLTSAHSYMALDTETMIPNVGCERCHGAGRPHVEAARRGAGDLRMPNGREGGPGGWSAATQMQLCGACHRLPGMAPEEAIDPDNAQLARFQPIGLMQSPCYRRGGGRMTCLACHDPHGPSSADRPSYVAACLACHAPARDPGTVCPVEPESGCIDCHMPRRETNNGMIFTDHWIRVHPAPPAAP